MVQPGGQFTKELRLLMTYLARRTASPVADQPYREFVEKASGQGFLDEFCFLLPGTIDGDGQRKTGNRSNGP